MATSNQPDADRRAAYREARLDGREREAVE
jgi:hypothetical protein